MTVFLGGLNGEMGRYPNICIVGLKCYDLLSGVKTPRYIGGIENQLVLLARGLVGQGFGVSFVTFDHGQPDGIEHGGIRVLKAFVSDGGIPGVRFLHPRWTGLWAALGHADADICYQMGAGCETGQVAMWCRRRRRHFIFATASDADCVPGLPLLKSHKEKYLYRYGLRTARIVVSQTREQQRLLSLHYGISSEVFRILSPPPQPQTMAREGRRRILWVGRISPEKRPHLLLDIARRLPEYTFDVIGDANANTDYARRFRNEAKSHPSVVLHGKVSNETLSQMYAEAALLVGTSETEGFPVTFIEAWSRGIPVVSMFDPDGVIRADGLGFVGEDTEAIASCVRQILQSQPVWLAAAEAARQYYLENHAPEVCMPRLERLFLEAAGHQPSGPVCRVQH